MSLSRSRVRLPAAWMGKELRIEESILPYKTTNDLDLVRPSLSMLIHVTHQQRAMSRPRIVHDRWSPLSLVATRVSHRVRLYDCFFVLPVLDGPPWFANAFRRRSFSRRRDISMTIRTAECAIGTKDRESARCSSVFVPNGRTVMSVGRIGADVEGDPDILIRITSQA
jgi:hypothetical protein